MKDLITIKGIEAFGYHGVFPHERREGQKFVADVEIQTSHSDAAQSDDVAHTIDYGVVANSVVEIIQGEPANLIETVCDRILTMVLALERVEAAQVTLHKPQAPIQVPFSDVSVTMHREAQH